MADEHPPHQHARAAAAGLFVALGGGIGLCWAADPFLGALVLSVCLLTAIVFGALLARRRRFSNTWETFEREFWDYVQAGADTKRTRRAQ